MEVPPAMVLVLMYMPQDYASIAGRAEGIGTATTDGSRRIVLLHCSVACRGDVLVARWRGRARRCYSIHSDRDPADQQAIDESHAGQAVSTNQRLLARWGRLHAVRSVLSAVALFLFAYLLAFAKSQ